MKSAFFLLPILISTSALADPSAELRLWTAAAPGDTPAESGLQEHEKETKPGEKALKRVADVSVPTIQHFAPEGKDTGACVLVCPGGGYNILAIEHEGTAVAEWLNGIGIHAVVLKYRVPRRSDREMYEAPLQDAQRALSMIRARSKEWGIDPRRLGILGFSAGGNLAAWATAQGERSYLAVDADDEQPCNVDFCLFIYPAYLGGAKVQPGASPLSLFKAKSPPSFIAVASDDSHAESSAAIYSRLLELKVPVELHSYAKGGHGFGLKPDGKGLAATTWTARATDWIEEMGFREELPVEEEKQAE